MKLKRRNFLLFLAGGTGAVALGTLSTRGKKSPMPFTNPKAQTAARSKSSFAFQAIKSLLPLETSVIIRDRQLEQYSKYEVVDDLLLPDNFTYELIAAWGAILYIPTRGANAGKAYLFSIKPMKCNTGYCFTPDEQTLFLSIQHSKEGHRIRRDQVTETTEVTITTTRSQKNQQNCSVPVGSNCLDKSNTATPKLSAIALSTSQSERVKKFAN